MAPTSPAPPPDPRPPRPPPRRQPAQGRPRRHASRPARPASRLRPGAPRPAPPAPPPPAISFDEVGTASSPAAGAVPPPFASTTVIVPDIVVGWTSQKNGNVPAVVKVWLNWSPLFLSLMPESNSLPGCGSFELPEVTE